MTVNVADHLNLKKIYMHDMYNNNKNMYRNFIYDFYNIYEVELKINGIVSML